MADSFIFYSSFQDSIDLVPKGQREEYYSWFIDVCLERASLEDVPFPVNVFVTQALASVNAAHERYDKAVEDGKKGGRPGTFIDPEEWQSFYDEHSRKETADHFGINEDTLRKWIQKTRYQKGDRAKKAKKAKNLNDNVNDNVNVNDNDNDNNIINNNINKKESLCGSALTAPAGFLKEGERQVGEPYEMDGKIYVTVDKPTGERVERCVKSS